MPDLISISTSHFSALLWPSKKPVYEKVTELSRKYGEAMTLWYGTQPMVILSSLDVIRSSIVDNSHDFASRPSDFLAELMTEDSIIFAKYNATWQKQKKLANRAMR